MPMWQLVAIGLIPSIAVAALFWYAMRAVVRADRNERAALADIDRADARAVVSADAPAGDGVGGADTGDVTGDAARPHRAGGAGEAPTAASGP